MTLAEAQLETLKSEAQLRLSDKISEQGTRLQELWKRYAGLTGHKVDVPLNDDITEANLNEVLSMLDEMEVTLAFLLLLHLVSHTCIPWLPVVARLPSSAHHVLLPL